MCIPGDISTWLRSGNHNYHFSYPTVLFGLCDNIAAGSITIGLRGNTVGRSGWLSAGFGANTHVAVGEVYDGLTQP